MPPFKRCIKLALLRIRNVTFNQLADQIKAVPRQLAIILSYRINGDGQRIVKIVIVKTGQSHIALQQIVLAHVAQHTFE